MADQFVVDLGCGAGSFDYAAYSCKVVAVDSNFESLNGKADRARVFYIQADLRSIPLQAAFADAVVCNHSLEHVHEPEKMLAEIKRILKPGGLVWISVPDGFGFDDALYRFLYSGGGHVNRFTFETLTRSVESATGMKLLQSCELMSGFVYCNPPAPAVRPYLPRRFKLLHALGILNPVLLSAVTSLADGILHSRFRRYGWGFIFGPPGPNVDPALPSYFNVCSACGAGNPASLLQSAAFKRFGFRFYRCPHCTHRNLFFKPAAGFQ